MPWGPPWGYHTVPMLGRLHLEVWAEPDQASYLPPNLPSKRGQRFWHIRRYGKTTSHWHQVCVLLVCTTYSGMIQWNRTTNKRFTRQTNCQTSDLAVNTSCQDCGGLRERTGNRHWKPLRDITNTLTQIKRNLNATCPTEHVVNYIHYLFTIRNESVSDKAFLMYQCGGTSQAFQSWGD